MITKKEAAERLAIIAAEIRLALDEGDEDCPSWADDLLTVADALHPSGFVDESGTGIDTRYSDPVRLRRRLRQMIEAEDALAQAIFLCDHLAEKQSNNHPEGNDFVTHYVIPHGLWAQVLREKQNLRDAFHKNLWPELGATR